MKNNRYLTIGLLTGFIVGGCMGVLGWAFLQNLFAIPICAGIGMLIGIVIGTLLIMEKIIKRNSKKALCFYTHRATLIQTFKIEYQPSTGGTTEQEIIETCC